jgi:hypothetical protein
MAELMIASLDIVLGVDLASRSLVDAWKTQATDPYPGNGPSLTRIRRVQRYSSAGVSVGGGPHFVLPQASHDCSQTSLMIVTFTAVPEYRFIDHGNSHCRDEQTRTKGVCVGQATG